MSPKKGFVPYFLVDFKYKILDLQTTIPVGPTVVHPLAILKAKLQAATEELRITEAAKDR